MATGPCHEMSCLSCCDTYFARLKRPDHLQASLCFDLRPRLPYRMNAACISSVWPGGRVCISPFVLDQHKEALHIMEPLQAHKALRMQLQSLATGYLPTNSTAVDQQPRTVPREVVTAKMVSFACHSVVDTADAVQNLLYTTSLEPFLGTYRIVWDSESAQEPRTPNSVSPMDLREGVLTLTRPEHSQQWPKEPSPKRGNGWPTEPELSSAHDSDPSSVVLHIYDTFLGADRSASKLTPSVCPTRTPTSSSASSDSSSSSTTSASESSCALNRKHLTRSWRFNWDSTFPRLGFRFEGMDMTTAWGHSLSFTDLTDDRGFPFAALELRPSGFLKDDRDPFTIVVLAKRQRDRFGREGLTETERVRLGMREAKFP